MRIAGRCYQLAVFIYEKNNDRIRLLVEFLELLINLLELIFIHHKVRTGHP
jgi:hypothetical protein